jgi:multiple sugar transport system permease protein
MLVGKKQSRVISGITLTILSVGLVAVITPIVWMFTSALKSQNAVNTMPPQFIPQEQVKVEIEGKDYFLYNIPVDGEMRQLALLEKDGPMGTFVNPENVEEQYFLPVADGERVTQVKLHWENFKLAVNQIPFWRYLLNTMIVVTFGTIGTVISCTLVAYGFSRFKAKGLGILFIILLSTMMLPSQVTLIPAFIVFRKIGWYDTLLPLIVPAFFANAYDVFLLRQFMMRLRPELDDAARIDGCGPLGILWHVIIPQCYPVLATVTIFTILYFWNDFYSPLIYLQSPEKLTLAVGLQSFSALYTKQTHLLMSASFLVLLPPILLFFFSQKVFIQGVVISGIKG